jgi:hypothetical protein
MEPQLHYSSEGESVFKEYFGMKIWELRHLAVSRFIDAKQIKSVIDFGCSDGKLVQRLARCAKI